MRCEAQGTSISDLDGGEFLYGSFLAGGNANQWTKSSPRGPHSSSLVQLRTETWNPTACTTRTRTRTRAGKATVEISQQQQRWYLELGRTDRSPGQTQG